MAKSVLFLGDYITKIKDKITLKSKGYVCGQTCSPCWAWRVAKPTSTPMVRKESCSKTAIKKCRKDQRPKTYQSVVGHLDVFSRDHRFRLAFLRQRSLAMASFFADQGVHMRRFENEFFALAFKHARHASAIDSAPRNSLTEIGLAGVIGSFWQTSTKKRRSDNWWSVDAWRSVRGLVWSRNTNQQL